MQVLIMINYNYEHEKTPYFCLISLNVRLVSIMECLLESGILSAANKLLVQGFHFYQLWCGMRKPAIWEIFEKTFFLSTINIHYFTQYSTCITLCASLFASCIPGKTRKSLTIVSGNDQF